MAPTFDKRLTPARPDLAAAHLRGQVEAARFVEGRAMRIATEVVDLRAAPRRDQSLDTQALFGEAVIVYEQTDEGWSWLQLESDSYVGYIPSESLRDDMPAPTHRVKATRTFVYPAANMKTPILMALPMNAQVNVSAMRGDFAEAPGLGFIWAAHLARHDEFESDFVGVAERFLDVPYLWGGKTFCGLDCSGLVQTALIACGKSSPRDTDMMAAGLGATMEIGDDLAGLRRGDLVFWKGHVGVMRDERTLLHANGHHMAVASEPLREARDRIAAKSFGAITAFKRLPA